MGIKDLPEVDRPQKLRARGTPGVVGRRIPRRPHPHRDEGEERGRAGPSAPGGRRSAARAVERGRPRPPPPARRGGEDLGIEVLVHIIVTKTNHTSLREQGYIP